MSEALQTQIDLDLKQAMKDRDEVAKRALRSLKTAITEAQKENQNQALDDEAILAVIAKGAKQRRDSIAEYEKANRPELAGEEEKELQILNRYLPAQLSDEVLADLLRQVIAEVGATSPKEMGRVMSAAMAKVQGQADGKRVNQIVRQLLSQG
jgi:uncharacterized protein YqeY